MLGDCLVKDDLIFLLPTQNILRIPAGVLLEIVSKVADNCGCQPPRAYKSAKIRDWILIVTDPVEDDQRGISVAHDGLA